MELNSDQDKSSVISEKSQKNNMANLVYRLYKQDVSQAFRFHRENLDPKWKH